MKLMTRELLAFREIAAGTWVAIFSADCPVTILKRQRDHRRRYDDQTI